MEIKNPCKGKCYDCQPLKDLCNGCGLRMSERSRWFMMTNKEKKKVLDRIKREQGGNPAG